jgi:hypothetical protein
MGKNLELEMLDSAAIGIASYDTQLLKVDDYISYDSSKS